MAAAEALAARGYAVTGTDAKRVGDDVRDALGAAGVALRDGEEGGDLLRGIATIVKSPGVPREAPVIAAALAAGIRVIGEVELGWRLLEHEFVALTGSNGKTTTVELIGHVYRAGGAAGDGRGQRRHGADLAAGDARAGRDGGVRGVVVPARGHGGVRARGRGAAEPGRGSPRPPRDL